LTIATTVEQAAAQEAVGAFARIHNVLQGARDETGAAWRPLWPSLAELGIFGVAVAEDAGGAGGTLADLAAMLEQAGYELIPGPVVTTSIGALLCSGAQIPAPLVDAIVTGRQPVAITAPHADAVIRIGTDGCRYLTGTFPSVHGAGTESLMILSAHHNAEATWVLVDPDQDGVEVTALPGIDFAAPMGRVVCCDVPVIGEISCAQGSVEGLHMIGIVAVCSGIAHLCADMLCRAEQAGVLAWDAASVGTDDRTSTFGAR
jgi:3-oxochol-4-en-24-oyl-CoA dehydrogenase